MKQEQARRLNLVGMEQSSWRAEDSKPSIAEVQSGIESHLGRLVPLAGHSGVIHALLGRAGARSGDYIKALETICSIVEGHLNGGKRELPELRALDDYLDAFAETAREWKGSAAHQSLVFRRDIFTPDADTRGMQGKLDSIFSLCFNECRRLDLSDEQAAAMLLIGRKAARLNAAIIEHVRSFELLSGPKRD